MAESHFLSEVCQELSVISIKVKRYKIGSTHYLTESSCTIL